MDPVFLQELAEVLVGPNPEVSIVFLFNGSYMGVFPLPAKRPRFVWMRIPRIPGASFICVNSGSNPIVLRNGRRAIDYPPVCYHW